MYWQNTNTTLSQIWNFLTQQPCFNCEGEHVWEGETKGPEETISLSAPVETVNISQYNATCTRFYSCFIHPQMASSTSPKVNTIGADLLLADQPHQWSFWWASNLDWHLMGFVISPVETWKGNKIHSLTSLLMPVLMGRIYGSSTGNNITQKLSIMCI